MKKDYIDKLSPKSPAKRISTLKILLKDFKYLSQDDELINTNRSFRSIYSCYKHTPSYLIYLAHKNGYSTFSIVENASLSSAFEVVRCGEFSKIPYYIGVETDVLDRKGKIITAGIIGVPHKNAWKLNSDLLPYRMSIDNYSSELRTKLNAKFKPYFIELPVPAWSIFSSAKIESEDDLYLSLARKITDKFMEKDGVLDFLKFELKLTLTELDIKIFDEFLSNSYLFGLANILKEKLSLDLPKRKLDPVSSFVSLSKKHGGLSFLSYNGEKIDCFLANAKLLGFNCVSIDLENFPNVDLDDYYEKSIKQGLLPIVRQVYNDNLYPSTFAFESLETAQKFKETNYAVIGHEIASSINLPDGLFSEESINTTPDLKKRIKLFSSIGNKQSIKI